VFFVSICLVISFVTLVAETAAASSEDRRNIILVLTDDQRFDELGFMNPVIETPNMDTLASGGVHFRNAFVTTSLCSPSRASILTGQFMHTHGVVDNNSSPPDGTVYFPAYLQKAGYDTAFVGKWHMGSTEARAGRDAPQPGFDHWVSFAGQGHYYPVVRPNGAVNQLNVNGAHVAQKGYITDELTDYALDWLNNRDGDRPFFLYLSHKAVHAEFKPAKRHEVLYSDVKIEVPESQADTEENYRGKPVWVRNQRNSWHGVDFPYHSELDIREYRRYYHRALAAVDDSLGRILAWLKENGLEQNTTVILMGDNGFLFGEHGLIDKRNAYEESIRVPLLAYAPGYLPANTVVDDIVANIDIAPTILDMAGVDKMPKQFEGISVLPATLGESTGESRTKLFYEYYWEYNFPHTPTTFALRTTRYKYIQYHGVWDTEELYDLQDDPKEMRNLVADPQHVGIVKTMRGDLYELLANSPDGSIVPFTEKKREGAVLRSKDGSSEGKYPDRWIK